MTEFSGRDLDRMAQNIFIELSDKLGPTQSMEVVAMLAACIAFASGKEGVDPDVAIDLMAKLARVKQQLLLAHFEEKEGKNVKH